MFIKGTEKIKGSLDLASIKQQLTKKSVLSINEKDYLNNDIQMGIRLGFISVDETDAVPVKSLMTDGITCINIFRRPIFINILQQEVKPNQIFIVPKDQMDNSEIKLALNHGMIAIHNSNVNNYNEETVHLNVDDKKLTIDDNDNRRLDLDTNEDLPMMEKEKEKEKIVWNPNRKGPSIKNAISSAQEPQDEPINPLDNEQRISPVVVNPNNKPIMSTIKGDVFNMGINKKIAAQKQNNEISFVDQEEKIKRIQKHPVLKNKQQNIDNDDPIAPDSVEENRIAKHPIFKDE